MGSPVNIRNHLVRRNIAYPVFDGPDSFGRFIKEGVAYKPCRISSGDRYDLDLVLASRQPDWRVVRLKLGLISINV